MFTGGSLGWCPGIKIWAFAIVGMDGLHSFYGPGRTHGSGVRIGSAKKLRSMAEALLAVKAA